MLRLVQNPFSTPQLRCLTRGVARYALPDECTPIRERAIARKLGDGSTDYYSTRIIKGVKDPRRVFCWRSIYIRSKVIGRVVFDSSFATTLELFNLIG